MQRIPALDGLRGLAAASVIGFHCFVPVLGGGFIGVDVFFALSGFLITSILVQEVHKSGRIGVIRFLGNRFVRLYPALLIMLSALVLFGPFLFDNLKIAQETILSGFYLSDFTLSLGRGPVYTQHTWSLSVEMQFYIIWPIVVLGLAKLTRSQAIKTLLGLFVIATLWRIMAYELYGPARAYYGFDTRVSGLILGSVLAFVDWRPSVSAANMMARAALVVLASAAFGLGFYSTVAASWGGLLVDLAAAALVLALLVSGSNASNFFARPVCVRLGAWSYGMYLWHYPLARLFREDFDPQIAFFLTFALSLGFAAASYELAEKPLRKWYRHKGRKKEMETAPTGCDGSTISTFRSR